MRFSPRNTKSNISCCALECKSYAKKDPTVRFHDLPKSGEVEIVNKLNIKEKVNRRQLWIKRLRISENFRHPKVCSLHFTKDDYLSDTELKNRLLKKDAAPSVNLPTNKPIMEKRKMEMIRAQRAEHRASRRKFLTEKVQNENEGPFTDSDIVLENNIDTVSCVDESVQGGNISTLEFVQERNNIITNTTFKDVYVQVEFERYTDFIRNEKDLNAMTGLSSFSLLYFLEDNIRFAVPNIELNLCQKSSKLSIKDRIVLTFRKLKQNVSYEVLSALFKIFCDGTCRRIFLRIVEILAAILQRAIRWPSKEEVLKNLPICFKDFANVRAVMDGIEINIQKPSKICCQTDAYSSYKSSYTIKFMTAVSPGGIITYVSDAYPGRSSDKAIFEQSKLIEKFDPNDGLMVDKGFLIDDICLKHGIQLIRPPFLRSKKQFSKEEALLNAKIAKARVHIERSNQRLKVFKILSTRVPSYLVSRIEQIFCIICDICNMDTSILKDDKFIVQ